jgi:ligand-binding sensor domain-containing protein/signal transduction histidine kinase
MRTGLVIALLRARLSHRTLAMLPRMARRVNWLLLASWFCIGTGLGSTTGDGPPPQPADTPAAPLEIRLPTWQVRQWKTPQGLPGNWIECVLQTSDGHLWLGTPDGLYRFDGRRFITLNHRNCDAFRSDVVKGLAEADGGVLWVATKQGVLRIRDGRVRHFSEADRLGGEETTSVSVGADGTVWVGTSGGLSGFREGVWRTWRDPSTERAFVYSVLARRDGGIMLGTDTGLRRLDPDTGTFSAVWEQPWSPEEPERGIVRCLMEDRRGRLWFGTDHAVFRSEAGGIRCWTQGRSSVENRVKCLMEDSAGRIWAVIGFELCRLEADEFVPMGAAFGLNDMVVNGLTEDRAGNLWVGTRYAGLSRLRPLPVQVVTRSGGLPGNRVLSVASDGDGGVRITTEEGVCAWESGRLWIPPQPGWEPGAALRGLVRDPTGDWWVYGVKGGFHPLAPEVEPTGPAPPRLLAGCDIRSVCRDSRGNFWFGCRDGLARWIPARPDDRADSGIHGEWWLFNRQGVFRTMLGANRHWTRSPDGKWSHADGTSLRDLDPGELPKGDRPGWPGEAPSEGFPDYDFTAIAEDADGDLWFGTERGGVVRLRDWHWDAFTKKDGLAGDRVTALLVGAEGHLWVGAEEGLSVRHDERFVSLNRGRGFPSDTVRQLLQDQAGNLWVGGERAIYRLRTEQVLDRARGGSGPLEVLRFDETDGLLSTEVHGKTQPGACRTLDGRLWFPTARGLVVIDPLQIREAAPAPAVTVRNVRCAGALRFDQDAFATEGPDGAAPSEAGETATSTSGGSLVLSPGSGRHLEIAYSSLALTAPERVRFRYRLTGFDEGWVEAGGRQVAYYTNLKPGRYRFEVMGSVPRGSWDGAARASFAFEILPHFTGTPLFKVLCGAGILALIFSVHRIRVGVLQRIHRLQHEAELAAERSRIARDMHDDLGARLHEILLLSEASRDGAPVVGRVGEAAREAAQSLEETVWAAQPAKDSFDHLITFLVQRSREILESAGVRLELAVPESLPAWPLQGARRQNLFLICREALRNAVLHGNPERVMIAVEIDGPTVRLSIRDNGSGFQPDAVEDRGNGLANMCHRAREARASLMIDSTPGKGTVVTLEWRQE